MSFTGKVVIVTGGASGIGLGIVKAFLSQGANVTVADVSSLDQFQGTTQVLAVKCDVSKEDEVNNVVDTTLAKWGRIDVLVNNAGIIDRFSHAAEVTDDSWRRCFAVNVDGPMFFIRRCIKVFLSQESRGSIVNVCSTASVRGSAAGVAYTATKHALLGVSRNTAFAYAKEGITCNAVLPGVVPNTNLVADFSKIDMPALKITEPYVALSPGSSSPDEVAQTVLHLASSRAVNGAEVAIDRGLLTA